MYAAVVTSFGSPPRYEEFPKPAPAGDHEVLVDVLAAGLHPRVRSQADGTHYTSTDELPMLRADVERAWRLAAHANRRIVLTGAQE